MKKLTLLFGVLLLLNSCYSNQKDLEKIEKLESQVKKLKEQNLFLSDKNKKDCLNKYNIIIDNINTNNETYSNIYELIEVFYSNKNNECYFTAFIDGNKYSPDVRFLGKRLFSFGMNVTNAQPLAGFNAGNESCDSEECKANKQSRESYENYIKELKN